ncbi:MAG: 1-acyl-sn-glycerol-3-phosphate acyltransferase, partial [Sinomicrobium sp.]|nr:1-acyl-sn-glycerol-3-phosphate acyltransferase [Sinomicrobium sp.]
MNPLLYALYQLLKVIVRLALRIFYPSKKYIHAERLRFDYPAILVSNHPNTLLDPLTVAAKTQKLVFFLANAGLFKSAFGNWFFNTFFCIPVTRPQDTNGQKKVSNEDSFARANDHLTSGGVLYIAPEGTSEMERRLRPLKTGTARIALSTEKKNDYKLGMAIIPVGLTYYRPRICGSRQIVNVGQPIFPQQYAEAYEADPIQAARTLTADLENEMRTLLIDTKDKTEDQRLRLLES